MIYICMCVWGTCNVREVCVHLHVSYIWMCEHILRHWKCTPTSSEPALLTHCSPHYSRMDEISLTHYLHIPYHITHTFLTNRSPNYLHYTPHYSHMNEITFTHCSNITHHIKHTFLTKCPPNYSPTHRGFTPAFLKLAPYTTISLIITDKLTKAYTGKAGLWSEEREVGREGGREGGKENERAAATPSNV